VVNQVRKLVGVFAEKFVGVLAVVGTAGVVVDARRTDHNAHNGKGALTNNITPTSASTPHVQ